MLLIRPIVLAALSCVAAVALGSPAAASEDTYAERQWHLEVVGAEEAWDTTTGTGVLVAVVDSGVDLTHPDLAANVVAYPDADMVEPEGACRGKGKACTEDGALDENGHGTHVAGIVAAVADNGIGVAGVAPNAKVLPVRVLDAEGGGSIDRIAAGIDYAVSKGAEVINLSLGFDAAIDVPLRALGFFESLETAIAKAWGAGAVVVVAAGNDSFPLCTEPAAYPNVVCAGATDRLDLISFYSNSDAQHPNYVTAPGGWGLGDFSLGDDSPTGVTCSGEIFSTYLRTQASYCSPESGYEGASGTSMAAPVVSGIAALLAARGLTNAQIVSCLKSTTADLGVPGRDPIYGYGRVDALAAVTSC